MGLLTVTRLPGRHPRYDAASVEELIRRSTSVAKM
jgi:hypothetical protein